MTQDALKNLALTSQSSQRLLQLASVDGSLNLVLQNQQQAGKNAGKAPEEKAAQLQKEPSLPKAEVK